MSFEDFESSVEDAIPITLYHFKYGPGANDYHAYTDHLEEFTYQSVRYLPVPIGRTDIEIDGSELGGVFTVDIYPEADIVDFIANKIPSQNIQLVIRQGHVDDPDNEFLVIWSGFAIGVERQGTFARIGGNNISMFFDRPIVKRRYRKGCGWVLYGSGCRATRNPRASVRPNRVGSNAIVVGSSFRGSLAGEKFVGGYISWQVAGRSHLRTILDVTEENMEATLLLQGDTDGLGTSDTIDIFVGCNHLESDCKNLHNNIINYGGQPNIPLENPVGTLNKFF